MCVSLPLSLSLSLFPSLLLIKEEQELNPTSEY